MIVRFFRDAAIGHSIRKAAEGILMQERFSGKTIVSIVDWSTEAADFEIIVRRKEGANDKSG